MNRPIEDDGFRAFIRYLALPCPICGYDPKLIKTVSPSEPRPSFHLACLKCGLSSRSIPINGDTIQFYAMEAIDAWNETVLDVLDSAKQEG